MAKDHEVERIAKKLDKMVHKKNTRSSGRWPNAPNIRNQVEAVQEYCGVLRYIAYFKEKLTSMGVAFGRSLGRKASPIMAMQDGAIYLLRELKIMKMSLETLQSTRIGMSVNAVRKQSSEEEVQTLAKALIKSWKKLLAVEEGKKREGSPLRSSTSKDSPGSSDRSKKQQLLEPPKTPTSPTTPKFTSFPPTPVTTDSVRTKCRELLVTALQTDGGLMMEWEYQGQFWEIQDGIGEAQLKRLV
ncbi:unnamed protein product, partial [Coregonus sp. 'balchen']